MWYNTEVEKTISGSTLDDMNKTLPGYGIPRPERSVEEGTRTLSPPAKRVFYVKRARYSRGPHSVRRAVHTGRTQRWTTGVV